MMASYIELNELVMCHDGKLVAEEVARLRNLIQLDNKYIVWLLENDPGDEGTANCVNMRNKANKEMLESIMNYYNNGQEDDPDGRI